jgi:hypothetical protein
MLSLAFFTIMLNVVMLSVVMLSVVMLSAVMLIVVAPFLRSGQSYKTFCHSTCATIN